jgi:hypothetical protein
MVKQIIAGKRNHCTSFNRLEVILFSRPYGTQCFTEYKDLKLTGAIIFHCSVVSDVITKFFSVVLRCSVKRSLQHRKVRIAA